MGGEFFSSVAKKTKKLRLRRHRKNKSATYGDGNLTEEEFEIVRSTLEKNRQVAAKSFANAYQIDREAPKLATDGTLGTTLTGDIWYVVEIHLKVLDDLLMLPHQPKSSDGKSKKRKDKKARHPFPFSKEQHEAIALEAITAIFRPLLLEQMRYCRTKLFPEDSSKKAVTSLEVYCAAANDFMALANQTEDLIQRLEKKYPFLTLTAEAVSDDSEEFDEEVKVEIEDDDDDNEVAMHLSSALIHAFTRNAVMAAQYVHVGCMQRAILYNPTAQKLFGFDWEDRFAANEVFEELLHNLNEILSQVQTYFSSEFLFEKFMQALCRAVVAAYLQRLARKANNPANIFLPPRNQHQNDLFISVPDDDEYDDDDLQDQLRNQPPLQGDELPSLSVLKYAIKSPKQRQGLPKNHRYNRFVSPSVAMGRIRRDIKVLEDFFLEFTQDRPTPFARVLKDELGLLETVYDYLNVVKGYERWKNDLMSELIVKFHKQSQLEFHVTRYFLTDLFHLMKPPLMGRKKLTKLWTQMEPQLQMMSYNIQLEAASEAQAKLDSIASRCSSSCVEPENDVLGLSISSASSAKSMNSESSFYWEGPAPLSTPTMLADYYEEKMHQQQVLCADPVQGCWDKVMQQQQLHKEETVMGCNPIKVWGHFMQQNAYHYSVDINTYHFEVI